MIVSFEVQKISNHGVGNPIVARLVIQSSDLLKFLNTDEANREEILLQCMELHRRLLGCFDIQSRLLFSRNETIENTKKILGEGCNTTPHVVSLQNEVEGFLLASKIYLREIARLLNLLFNAELPSEAGIFWNPKGQKSEVAIWAENTFGLDHEIYKMLTAESEWVAELVRKRNAVEHPGGWSGDLRVINFERMPGGGIRPPVWGREVDGEGEVTDIYSDISHLIDNMLTVAEDIIALAIGINPVSPYISIGMIPENERDGNCPVRLRAVLKTIR